MIVVMPRIGWYTPVEPPRRSLHLLLCAWTAEPTGPHTLVPDACCDLLWLSSGRLVFCGPETTAWTFELPAGTTAVGVRFRAGAPSALFKMSLANLREQRVESETILGSELVSDWSRRIEQAETLERRRDVLVSLFCDRYADRDPDPFAEAVVARLLSAPHEHLSDLAVSLSTHPRTLHRRCLRLFGYPPSTLGRMIRLQRFLALKAAGANPDLAELAVSSGYTDQSHLARECRRITGRSPTVLLAQYFSTFPDMSDPYKNGREIGASIRI